MKLSIKEVSAELTETPDVVRNWVKEYKGFIPVEKAENGYNLYGPEALDVLRTIKKLKREQKFSARQIAHYLAGSGEVAAAADPAAPADASAEIAELRQMVTQLLEQNEKQMEFNRQLIDRLDQREQRDQARDQLVTQFLTERRELIEQQRQQQEQQPDQEQPRGFFARLLRKK